MAENSAGGVFLEGAIVDIKKSSKGMMGTGKKRAGVLIIPVCGKRKPVLVPIKFLLGVPLSA